MSRIRMGLLPGLLLALALALALGACSGGGGKGNGVASLGNGKATTAKIVLGVGLGAVTLAAGLAAVGTSRTTHVLTVSRTTTASPKAIWELWADVANRTSWDDGLEAARIDGPFQQGASGEVTLRDQPPRRFQVIERQPMRRYTDRFYLPIGTTMDWHHSLAERGPNQRQVTFRVVANGPSSLVLAPVLRRVLEGELPQTVDKLINLAEHS